MAAAERPSPDYLRGLEDQDADTRASIIALVRKLAYASPSLRLDYARLVKAIEAKVDRAVDTKASP